MMTVLGGRVIPFFTRRGLGNMAPACPPWLDRACLLLSVAVPLAFASGLADTPRIALALLFSALFALHTARLALWHDRALWRVPCCGRCTWPMPGLPLPAWAWRCGMPGWRWARAW